MKKLLFLILLVSIGLISEAQSLLDVRGKRVIADNSLIVGLTKYQIDSIRNDTLHLGYSTKSIFTGKAIGDYLRGQLSSFSGSFVLNVGNLGEGQPILVPRGDTLYSRVFAPSRFVNIDTLLDGAVTVSLNQDSVKKWLDSVYSASGAGSGTVTTVSVVSANGFAGTVATSTTTPAITITTTVTGMLKSNGVALQAATPGVDFTTPSSTENVTNKNFTSGTNTFPTFNQNTTGSSAKWTTSRTVSITGDITYTSPGFDGSSNVTNSATVVRINGTSLAGLSTGLYKNTTGTGVPSIAVPETDYVTPSGAGALTNKSVNGVTLDATGSSTQYLNKSGTYTTPAGGGSSPLTTDGDLYTRISGADARLPISTNGRALRVVSGALAWVDTVALVPLALTSVINGDQLRYNGTVFENFTPPAVEATVMLSADVTNNNVSANTIIDVTGLSFPVVSGNTYYFKFFISYTAAASTTGARFSVNGPATSMLTYHSSYTSSTTGVTLNENLTSYDNPAASNAQSGATTGNIAIVEGILTASGNGNVIARFASEVSSSAIIAKTGSYLIYKKLN